MEICPYHSNELHDGSLSGTPAQAVDVAAENVQTPPVIANEGAQALRQTGSGSIPSSTPPSGEETFRLLNSSSMNESWQTGSGSIPSSTPPSGEETFRLLSSRSVNESWQTGSGSIPLELRLYRSQDCPVLLDLFRNTVRNVNSRDYSPQQIAAWIECVDPERWQITLAQHLTLVAELDGVVVGFADIVPETGYLDRLYVHCDYQRLGIATALCNRLEPLSQTGKVFSDVSVTAEPFFAARGYQVVRRQLVERCGVLLPNCVMLRKLTNSMDR